MTCPDSMLTGVYETAFRSLLLRCRPRQLQRGVALLLARAEARIARGTPRRESFMDVYQRCRSRTIQRLVRLRELGDASRGRRDGGSSYCSSERPRDSVAGRRSRRAEQLRLVLEERLPPQPFATLSTQPSPDFHCDSGLGGLARWLRAAGYDARFWPNVDDDELLEHVLRSDGIMLTTDRPLMERAIVRWGVVPALLVPLGPGKRDQYSWVVGCLQLPRKPARCMDCGGMLCPVDKQSIRTEIPPRTYPWCDDYFRCLRCQKLYWRGTHWQRIDDFLEAT